ncbi:ABC transporter substrate-binding protein [Pseudonocardia kujensis]|uniref:ABC transporter substrate-binding protein n=1 Tax=Pseudonocardia kujensis TaxID=1128675 RepID=UPI001E55CC79|nr:ABC transporter substrate-binding protein [Pseudonocardia kujensis]MCE0764898.1 ABC transporter substrate-binding protein [Pseudonocardia kujensis]
MDSMTDENDFCVQVDDRGVLVSVEAGAGADVPVGLLSAVAALGRAPEVDRRRFIWVGSGRAETWLVVVDVPGDAPRRVVVAGRRTYQLPFGLTLRELDVLTLLASGSTNGDIARRLELSTRTVTTHVDRIMRKLGVAGRTSAAVIAVEEGLLRVPLPGGDEGFEALRLGRELTGIPSPRTRDLRLPPVRITRHPLVIGAALPMRGFAAADGIEMAQATGLAVEEINSRGGIDGRLLSVEIVDVDILDADSIRRTFTQLAERDVDVLTSGYLTHQDVAHDIAADSGIPYLHAATMTAMEERVRSDPGRFSRVFQVCPSDVNYAPRFVEQMTALRDEGTWAPSSNRLAVVLSPWTLGGPAGPSDLGVAEAARIAEADGWALEVIQPLAADTLHTWAGVAERVARTEPAAVMLGHYLLEGTISFLDAFQAAPSDTLVYSIYAPSVRAFREMLGSKAEGLLWATVTGTYSDPLARAFAGRYARRFGVQPGRSHAGIAYDRVRLMAGAWSQAANARDRGAVADELRHGVLRGVNGSYWFGNDSQTALSYSGRAVDPSLSQAHLVFQIQDGRQRILAPAPYADARFRPQPWLTRSRALA